jgi:hypothetical protein
MLLRLKRCHACSQCHASRVYTASCLVPRHCKFRLNQQANRGSKAVRNSFLWLGICTRGCRWFPRLLAPSQASMRVTNSIPLSFSQANSRTVGLVHYVATLQGMIMTLSLTDDVTQRHTLSHNTAGGSSGTACCSRVTCAGLRTDILHSRMPLRFTPLLVRLKHCHACDQCHFSRRVVFLTGWHCK